MLITIFIVFWLICSFLEYGYAFAYFQGRFPITAEKDYKNDMRHCMCFGFFGPIALISTWLGIGKDWSKYGFKLY